MTYGGNSSSAPTYTVTNGNDNLTGTYNYSSSRNLRKNSHQKFTLEDKFKEIRLYMKNLSINLLSSIKETNWEIFYFIYVFHIFSF